MFIIDDIEALIKKEGHSHTVAGSKTLFILFAGAPVEICATRPGDGDNVSAFIVEQQTCHRARYSKGSGSKGRL